MNLGILEHILTFLVFKVEAAIYQQCINKYVAVKMLGDITKNIINLTKMHYQPKIEQ
jgi:hypothetical protein